MDLDQTLNLAKRGKFSRAEIYSGLCAMAEERREPGQSQHQSFAKFVSGEGRELFQVCQSLPGRDVDTAWSLPVAKSAPNDWEGLVNNLMRLEKCSRGKAIDAALSSEAGRYLFKMQKRAEQVATGQYSHADMAALDGADAQVETNADIHKRSSQHAFEAMVDDAMHKFRLTRSAAMDHVRSTEDGLEAWESFKKLNGARLPQGHVPQSGDEHPTAATSGRTPPVRSPQWQSDHSGSTPTTPARTPERPSETPAVKRWLSMVKRLQFDCGLTHERATEIAKLTTEGREVYQRILAEAAAG
jgi:hypothetical protein